MVSYLRLTCVCAGFVLANLGEVAWAESAATDAKPQTLSPVVVIVYPDEAAPVQLAAQDLARYLGELLDTSVPLIQDFDSRSGLTRSILLATPASQSDVPPTLAPVLSRSELEPLGNDGCRAVCQGSVLVLAGLMSRGAANAVWTYLEEFCHVGFFWDTDHVGRLSDLPFETVSFRHVPRFAERYCSPPGGYTLAEHMDWCDWRREIDWRVHKRQNLLWGPGGELVWKQVFAELAGQVYTPTETDREQDDLYHKMANYARDRGLTTIMPGFLGEVPAEFVPPYPEASPGESPEEKHSIKLDFAAAVQRARDEVCPDMIWLADSWAFLTADFWPLAEVKAFCDAIADPDRFRIYDTWGEERPMWTLHNAYWGKNWTFGVLQCFGGNTTLHGDLCALVRDVQRVATDPRAGNCVGLYLVPEVLHHNDLYFDLAMRLAWYPSSVTCDGSRRPATSCLSGKGAPTWTTPGAMTWRS
ncbi:MAG: hypothetical protein HY706_08365 [Candidatus Hydrogenedentes bacterium]|nr:hypothetical protein [Candidatus Hydrogenedentota bacterium]